MVTNLHQRKLLVVDDEPLIRQTLDLCLRDEYAVTTVSSGEEALEASRRETYPVVILDLCMEGLSGIETLKRLKQIREMQNVIILTAYESTGTAISALNYGAFNYLTKPFERGHLKEVIARGFENYEQQNLREHDLQNRLMNLHDTFFSLLCHEFNTPLNSILGFSQMLANDLDDPEKASWAREISDSGTKLHEVLMEIVDYISASHMATAGLETEFVLGSLLRPVVAGLRLKDISVTVESSPVIDRKLAGLSGSFRTIIRKLLSMASHQSDRIRLDARLMRKGDDEQVTLRVEVTGTGLGQATSGGRGLGRYFEPYQYTPSDGAGQRTSLGLELATCRKIAEYARGSVDCFSTEAGEIALRADLPVRVIE